MIFKNKSFSDIKDSISKTIDNIGIELNRSSINENNERELSAILKKILINIVNDQTYWDEATDYCRQYYWSTLTSNIKAEKKDSTDIFLSLYPFLTEYRLTSLRPLDEDLELSIEMLKESHEKLSDRVKERIKTINSNLMFEIYKHRLRNNEAAITKEFINASQDVNDFNTRWEKRLQEKELRVDALEKRLEDIKHKYNFIGLSDGFVQIKKDKEFEKLLTFIVMVFFFIAIVSPIAWEITVLYKLESNYNILKSKAILLIPITSLVFILIYFFRIALHNYQSVKAQIVQLDLRINLCAFIDGYVEFKDKIESGHENSLEKFESLIFSNIATTGEKIPSTYDGVESLATLISQLKR